MSEKHAASSADSETRAAESEDADIAYAAEQAEVTLAERHEKASASLQALVDKYSQTKVQLIADETNEESSRQRAQAPD